MSFRNCLTLIILILIKINIVSQNLGENWIILYNKNNLKIEIKFRIENDGCENNGYPSTFEYRYNGYLLNKKSYLNWKIDYVNCNGMYYTYSNGLEIGGLHIKNQLGNGKLEDSGKEAFDDHITSKKIISNKPYDIRIGSSIIKSNKESIMLPDKILGNGIVCRGKTTKLYINKNEIGKSIEKMEWFRNTCENKNLIGTGETKIVRPIKDTKYYFRSTSKSGLKSKCLEKIIKVKKANNAANSITLSQNSICAGDVVKLIADGGSKEEWIWENLNKNSVIGKGNSITIKPKENITIGLYSDNKVCEKSLSISKGIEVNPKSNIQRISSDYNKRNKFILKLENSSLAPNSQYNWFYEKNNEKKLLKSGVDEIYPKKENTIYFVNTTGSICDKPEEFRKIEVKKLPKYDWNYANVDSNKKNHHHLGFNIGYSGFIFNDSIISTSTIFANEKHEILNNGLLIGFTYHPIFLKRFSLGIHGDYSSGFKFLNKIKYKKNNYLYLYDNTFSKINASIEIALGIKCIKLLTGYNFMTFNNNLNTSKATGSRPNYDVFQTFQSNEKIINQSIKLGLRIGQYDHGKKVKKSGNILDISITMNKIIRNKKFNFDDFKNNHNNIENWNPGINISWWKHRIFNMGVDAIYYNNYKTLNINTLDLNKLICKLRFSYSFDRFK